MMPQTRCQQASLHSWYTSCPQQGLLESKYHGTDFYAWTIEHAALLRDHPNFTRQVPLMLQEDDASIRKEAARETRLPLATFPEACLWTVEQMFDEDFWPEETADDKRTERDATESAP